MHSTRDSAAIDSDRTEPYVSRGTKDRDPLKQDKLDTIETKKIKKKEESKAFKKWKKKNCYRTKLTKHV